MKKLQSDLTTPEQSKRLLELGVPADSANHYYPDYGSIPMVVWTETQPRDLRRGILKPCWSVGRLMEILDICDISEVKDEYPRTDEVTKIFGSVIEYLVRTFEYMKVKLDFSKLED